MDVIDEYNIPASPITTDNITFPTSISIYILRYTNRQENSNIQVLFPDDIKFNLVEQTIFDESQTTNYYYKKDSQILLYELQLNLKWNDYGKPLIFFDHRWHDFSSYRIRISQKRAKMSHHFDDNSTRSLFQDSSFSDQFLFDVHFEQNAIVFSPPGQDVPFWESLCYFTYYIILTKNVQKFDSFLRQYEFVLRDQNWKLTREILQMFFQLCRTFYPSIQTIIENDIHALKILIRMFSVLFFNEDNMIIDTAVVRSFVSIIFEIISKNFDMILNSNDEYEWSSIRKGLINLFCIQICYQSLEPIGLLSKMPENDQITVDLIDLLSALRISPSRNQSIELISLVNPTYLTLQHLELAASFEIYINFLVQFVQFHQETESELIETISNHLDKLLGEKQRLSIDLNDILFILKYLKNETNSTGCISIILQSHKILQKKILSCLNLKNYHLTTNELPIIYEILFKYYHQRILFSIDRQQYVLRTLHRRDDRTAEYFIDWFRYFLAQNPIQGVLYKKNLIRQWTLCFQHDRNLFKKILLNIDLFCQWWSDNEVDDLHFFLTHIISQCFQGDIFDLIRDSLKNIKNMNFIEEFQKAFLKNQLQHVEIESFKMIQNPENPLVQLMNIDHQQNRLVQILINLIFSLIKIKDDELLSNTLKSPTRTSFIYAILFHSSFVSFDLHRQVIERLVEQLKRWEENGLYASDVYIWRGFSQEQRSLFRQIWTLVTQSIKRSYELDNLFEQTRLEMEEKQEMTAKILRCIEIYCLQATDRDQYEKCVQKIRENLQKIPIKSVLIPNELELLLPFIKTLHPFTNTTCWKTFLEHKRTGKIDRQQKESFDEETWPDFTLPSNVISEQPKATIEIVRRPCIEILQETVGFFDDFQSILQYLSREHNHLPIQEILRLFPDIHHAENDLQSLRSLINPETHSHLLSIVLFWKHRIHIKHICQGLLILSDKINATIDTNVLRNILDIKENTSGSDCISMIEQYHTQIENNLSEDILTFISYYSSSTDLFQFVDMITLEDVDNLKESINDYEHILIDAAIVFDLSVVMTFLDCFYTAIRIQQEKLQNLPLRLEHIGDCIKEIWQDDQFNDLLKCFESTSIALTCIQRVHLELTDKEQAKRHRIADILNHSMISFVFTDENYETKFDINVVFAMQQSTNKDEVKTHEIKSTSLNELRDRARLLEYSTNINRRNISQAQSEQDKIKLHYFIGFTDLINSTLQKLNILYSKGYPDTSKFTAPQKTFSCIDGIFHELSDNHDILKHLLHQWEQTLCSMYQAHHDLTYFTGNQFWLVEDYIFKRSSLSHSGYHLLKYIDIDPHAIDQLNYRPETPEDRLQLLGQILTQQRSSIIQRTSSWKKCFLVETTNEGILRAILSLFSRTKTTPKVHQLFFCTSQTNWIEMQAFIYRCFFSSSFHLLIRPELLSQFIQDQSVRLLRTLSDQHEGHCFQMGIITSETPAHQQLISGIQSMDMLTILRDQDLMNQEQLDKSIQELVQHCTIVTSRTTGLGKSTVIQQKIRRSGKNYVKFPLCGDFPIDSLAERLRDKYEKLEIGALHVDIGFCENNRQLNEMLSCLVLFGSFRFGQEAVSLPKGIPIYIELDASPESKLYDLAIFQHIRISEFIQRLDWAILDIERKDIQTVANYLQAITDDTIAKQNITMSTMKKLDLNTCIRLIQIPFLESKNAEFITWSQLSIFIAAFDRLFTDFSLCPYFDVKNIPQLELRTELVQILLQSSNQFTSLSVDTVRRQQRCVGTDHSIYYSEHVIKWEHTKPFTMVFTESQVPLFVYKKISDVPPVLANYLTRYCQAITGTKTVTLEDIVPDYDKLTHTGFFKKLTSLSEKYFSKSICPRCFRQYKYSTRQCQTCQTQDLLIRSKSFNPVDQVKFQENIAEQLRNNYVLTSDNYIKMLLIYMRVLSGIPVLIMGETGCGKTALIQFLCQKILDDEMEVFRMHAGISAETIVETMNRYIEKAEDCRKEKKRLWIFFDEFNTTTNIGVLKEIICERTLLGQSIPSNIVFLGACNPRRRKTKKLNINDDAHIGLRKSRYEMQRCLSKSTDRSLLYTVVPIPETMLEYIWDYGYLNASTEKTYVQTMLNSCHNLSTNTLLCNLTINLLIESQNHFRDLEDVSSVSLRDIARFCRLYNWFHDSLIKRESQNTNNRAPHLFILRSSFIALLLCYYFRLRSRKLQQIYLQKMELIMARSYPNIAKTPNHLRRFLEYEQSQLIGGKLELPLGTAYNRALSDNTFVLFACIINRIPLILCGKPGTSKSSAVQILITNLKGKKSKDPYFQTLPELVPVTFQGSQNCTSESIIQIFERAAKYSQVKDQSELLPVIIFDEIGLAELSPHNPLKVLHAELEVENNKYGFVGISNWRLDASKMNRALYLSIPDPDVRDLEGTGSTIAKSIQQQMEAEHLSIEPNVIRSLAQAYYDLCQNLQDTQPDHENYFGLRDYYCLIKSIIRDLVDKKDTADVYEIVRKQLKVNFDGVLDGSLLLWQQFCDHMHRTDLFDVYIHPTFDVLLDQAVATRSGRYLMLIADSDSTIDYVERFISVHQQRHHFNVKTLVGSSFPDDLISPNTYTEQYNYRVLMDIILYAETNITLIMRQMGHLYDSLYDLFNQNFSVFAKKKYCRIALGASYYPRCLVNDDFYCVVFIHNRDLDKCDPPFLNRFEKHIIDIQSLIHPLHFSLTRRLQTWIDSLLPKDLGKHFPLRQHLFVNYSEDQLCCLVMDAFEHLHISVDEEQTDEKTETIIDYCQSKLIRTSSFDLPLVLSLNLTPDNQALIQQYYHIHSSLTFPKLLQQSIKQKDSNIRIIYTYTQIFDKINDLPNDVEEVNLSNFKTERELTVRIKQHYQSSSTSNVRLLLIRVDYHGEHQHIQSLKYVILNETKSKNDHEVWIVFHLQRNLLNQTRNDVLFYGWSSDMIDDLNNVEIIPQNVVENPCYRDLALQHERTYVDMFDELVDRCLAKFRYVTMWRQDENQINDRRNMLFEQLTTRNKNPTLGIHLRSLMQAYIKTFIETNVAADKILFTDWRRDLLLNSIVIATSRSFNDALKSTIAMYYEAYFTLFLSHLEKHNFIDAYIFFESVMDKNILQHLSKLWIDCLQSSLQNIDTTAIHREIIEMPLVFDLKLPCASATYENTRSIRDKLLQIGEVDDLPMDIDSLLEHLQTSKVYSDDFMKLVYSDQQIFQYFFHDQIIMHLIDTNINLSPQFVYQLLTANRTRTVQQYKRMFLVEHVELTNILRLFETSLQLVSEEQILLQLQQQLISDPSDEIRCSAFYTLVLSNQHNYQLPPKVTNIDDKWLFKCKGDPMIETSLMNLIELILSPDVIDQADNIQQIITVFSLIASGIRDLTSYWVNNLEKLRTYLSLVRCFVTLIPIQALDALQTVCRSGFEGKFQSCLDVDRFVDDIRNIINELPSIVTNDVIQRTLVKLEDDFLKDWLVDNIDSYGEVLTLINKSDNNLWYYSAKIFTIIDQKLDPLGILQENNGRISLNEDYEKFNGVLTSDEMDTRKLQQLLVNRLHMKLMMNVDENQIEVELTGQFQRFLESIGQMKNIENLSNSELVFLLAWFKYYIQMYAFALNNDMKLYALARVDQILTDNGTPFGSTLKLFIIKQLLQMSKLDSYNLKIIYVNRAVTWMRHFFEQTQEQETNKRVQLMFLPTPLFQCSDEFENVFKILKQRKKSNELLRLINECGTSQKLFYAFLCWFIHYYSRFTINNASIDDAFVQLLARDLSEDLIRSFTRLGHRFIVSLCSDFSPNSYFHLTSNMQTKDIHLRLLALNITALFISFRSQPTSTFLASILYDAHQQFPKNIIQHISNICLPGLSISNPVITQMIDVRTQIEQRLQRNQIYKRGKFIFQCSSECPWMFYFENCGVPNDRSTCPICKKPIGAERHNVLIVRDPPQIKMTIEEGLQTIDQYLKQYNQTSRLGYHNKNTAAITTRGEKPDHLDRPLSFRFIHLLTHGLFLFLHDSDFLNDNDIRLQWKITSPTHFRDHFHEDYELITQSSTDPQQTYIWLYKLINHLVDDQFSIQGVMNTNAAVVHIEQLIERQLIFPHINSIDNEITQYKAAYAQFIQRHHSQRSLQHFIDELDQDEDQYPFLNFFNVTRFHTTNLLDEFILKIQTLPFVEQTYPVTSFLLKRLDQYSNIQHLSPIVTFTNYLIEKFNHRIKRIDAAETKIQHYLTNGNDQETIQQLYEGFVRAWYALNLKQVRYGCQTPKFERDLPMERFAEETSIATVLLNTSKDESSLLLAACLKTIAELQNEIVNYFHSITKDVDGRQRKPKEVRLQSIRPEHILQLDRNELSRLLVKDCVVVNYEYGRGKDMIYDYEEMEMTLRNMISSLVLIDTNKLHFLNYQFELYGENSSLINDVRARIKQEQLSTTDRMEIASLIIQMKNDDILNYLGSLDYIFTYLRNSPIENITENTTIQAFVENNIHFSSCLSDNVLDRPMLSTIQLRFIIDLYEILEENAFDQVLGAYVKNELTEETFSEEERLRVLEKFSRATFENEKIALPLKKIDCWISMLKRLMIRVLNANVSLDVPLQLYLQRTDLWSDRITDVDLGTFEVDDSVLLQHTYVILIDLQRKKAGGATTSSAEREKKRIESAQEQHQKVQAWFKETNKPSNKSKTMTLKNNNGKFRPK